MWYCKRLKRLGAKPAEKMAYAVFSFVRLLSFEISVWRILTSVKLAQLWKFFYKK